MRKLVEKWEEYPVLGSFILGDNRTSAVFASDDVSCDDENGQNMTDVDDDHRTSIKI